MPKPTRPHYVSFYVKDFLADVHVQAMTLAERGAYITLLCHAWQADPPATLPDDDDALAKLVGCSAERWGRIKASTLRPFTPMLEHARASTPPRLVQKRLLAEYEIATRKSRQNSNRATNAAVSRWNNRNKVTSSSIPDEVVTNANQNQNQNQKKEENPIPLSGGVEKPARRKRVPTKPDPLFDRFWAAYPLKVGKAAAAQAFAKLAADEPLLARLLAAIEWQVRSERWTKEAGRFIPHASTWLNGRRWEDEPPKVAAAPAKETIPEIVRRIAAESKARKESANGNA